MEMDEGKAEREPDRQGIAGRCGGWGCMRARAPHGARALDAPSGSVDDPRRYSWVSARSREGYPRRGAEKSNDGAHQSSPVVNKKNRNAKLCERMRV